MAGIYIPPGYEELIPPPNPITSLEQSQEAPLEGGLILGRAYSNIRSVPVSPENQAKKYNQVGYSNGITIAGNTFFNTVSFSEFIPIERKALLNYSVTANPSPYILADQIDFSVSRVKDINDSPTVYDDFVYNTLSQTKIFNSFSIKIQNYLENIYTAGGAPIKDLITDSFKQALLFGEDSNFAERDFELIDAGKRNRTLLAKSVNQATNNIEVLSRIINNSYSLDPDSYNIVNKNRMLNWKSLAEDLNKRVVYKTAGGTETPIYIPNSETLTTVLTDGTVTSISMKDGDYFSANPVAGNDRLTVFTDVSEAVTLDSMKIAEGFGLLGTSYEVIGECESTDQDLVEFNYDVTSTRKDFYFLKADLASIKDVESTDLLSRKTSATYEYITTGIDDYVKHKAFPYLLVYLRHDDMLFNHLEVAKSMTFTFSDLTLDKLTNDSSVLFPRKFPWSIVLIPSNETSKVITHQRSFLNSFKKRTLRLTMSPLFTDIDRGIRDPFYLTSVYSTDNSINFNIDIERTAVYKEDMEYIFNSTKLTELNKYNNGSEPLPRKVMPTGTILKQLNTMKSVYSLTDRDSISMYDLLTRIDPKYFQSLVWDQTSVNKFKTKLYFNNTTSDEIINKTYFVPVKEAAEVGLVSPTFLKDTMVTTFTKTATIMASPIKIKPGGAVPI